MIEGVLVLNYSSLLPDGEAGLHVQPAAGLMILVKPLWGLVGVMHCLIACMQHWTTFFPA